MVMIYLFGVQRIYEDWNVDSITTRSGCASPGFTHEWANGEYIGIVFNTHNDRGSVGGWWTTVGI